MLRDAVMKHMPKLSEEMQIGGGLSDLLVDIIADAKAVRMDEKAMALIDSYLDDLSQDGYVDMLQNARIAWPSLWIELKIDDGSTAGALITQDERGTKSIAFFIEDMDQATRIPPLALVTLDQNRPGSVILQKTPFLDAYAMMEGDEAAKSMLNEAERQSLRLASIATVFSIMLAHGVMAESSKVQPISKLKRESFARQGVKPPKTRVQKIDLTDLGRRDLDARKAPSSSSDVTKGKRRAHWVRGHIFLARNGKMTYRKPHIRGGGELKVGMTHVTASKEDSGPEMDL